MNFRELYLEQCKVVASYQASLQDKEVELQSVKPQPQNEQFDY
jgi:hypothetical protein